MTDKLTVIRNRPRLGKVKAALAALPLLAVGLLFAVSSPVAALTNTQYALASSGSDANVGEAYKGTPDGRYGIFTSNASNVVSGDTNGTYDVFLHNNATSTTSRVSVSSAGTQGNGSSNSAFITNNGRYVMFDSYADNLATLPTLPINAHYNNGVYLRDTVNNTTELLLTGYYVGSTHEYFYAQALSEDARFIYFTKQSDSFSGDKQFMLDRTTSTITQIDKSASGVSSSSGNSDLTTTSCDGRFAVFQSDASNLVSGDSNGTSDVYLVDTVGGHTIKSLTFNGNGSFAGSNPKISCDGNYVTFISASSNLVSGDTNGKIDVFVYDVARDELKIGSLDTGGTQFTNDSSGNYQLSSDGRYLAFDTDVTIGGNTYSQAYIRNIETNTSKIISQNSSSQLGNASSGVRWLKFDGGEAIFNSSADNLGFTNTSHDNYLYKSTDIGV